MVVKNDSFIFLLERTGGFGYAKPSVSRVNEMIYLLTKEQMEKEKKRSKNLGFPYVPAIYEIPSKKKKNKPKEER